MRLHGDVAEAGLPPNMPSDANQLDAVTLDVMEDSEVDEQATQVS